MRVSLGSFPRRIQGGSRRNLRAVPNGEECREFQKQFFAHADPEDIARAAGCTPRAAENIRDGENGMQMKFLVALCRNDPTFRAAFFELCGGKLQFPPEITAALSKAASWFEAEGRGE